MAAPIVDSVVKFPKPRIARPVMTKPAPRRRRSRKFSPAAILWLTGLRLLLWAALQLAAAATVLRLLGY